MFVDRISDRESPDARVTSRRQMLGGAVGAFGLAASGLFLPAELAEVEAREGAAGGSLGGRRAGNRRGRDKNRGRKRDRGKQQSGGGKAPGGALIRYVGCEVTSNDYTWDELQVDFYYRIKGTLDTWSSLKFARTQGVGAATLDYSPDRYSIAVYIRASNLERGCLVEMRNPLIFAAVANVTIGGSVNASGDYVGGTDQGWEDADDTPIVRTFGNATFPFGVVPVDVNVHQTRQTDTHKRFRIAIIRG